MKVLVVYCHPCPDSFAAALRDTVLAALAAAGHETRLRDLYAEGFDPVMGEAERRGYHTPVENERPVADHLADLRWCDGLVFVYPTWWYAQPAMLKGWLDRVWIPHATFTMPEGQGPIGRVLTNIRSIAVVTTLGAPWWWWMVIGAPGRRILLSGFKPLVHPRCRTRWFGLHRMDSVTQADRERFLAKVKERIGRME